MSASPLTSRQEPLTNLNRRINSLKLDRKLPSPITVRIRHRRRIQVEVRVHRRIWTSDTLSNIPCLNTKKQHSQGQMYGYTADS